MFSAQWLFGEAELAPARLVREEVFVKEQGASRDEEFDALDAYAAHVYVSLDTGEAVATGRMYPDGDALLIDRIAVMPNHRSLPYDDLVLRLLMYRAQELPQTYIKLYVPEAVIDAFAYSRFGFKPTGFVKLIRGARYGELSLRRDSIIWDSDCKHGDSPCDTSEKKV